jgi:hypothetical protein
MAEEDATFLLGKRWNLLPPILSNEPGEDINLDKYLALRLNFC